MVAVCQKMKLFILLVYSGGILLHFQKMNGVVKTVTVLSDGGLMRILWRGTLSRVTLMSF